MRRSMMVLVLGLVGMAFVAGVWAADLTEEFAKLAAGYDAALLAQDAQALDRLFDAEATVVGAEGRLDHKAAVIADVTKRKYQSAKTSDQVLRAIGDNVVVETGTFKAAGQAADGKPFTEHLRYIDVWVKKNGRWVIVAEQSTAIQPKQ